MGEGTASIADDLEPVGRLDWLEAVDGVLQGRPFDALVSSTHDGIKIAPLYTSAELTEDPARYAVAMDPHRIERGPEVRQHHLVTSPIAAILDDLHNGVDSIELAPNDRGWKVDELVCVLEFITAEMKREPRSDLDADEAARQTLKASLALAPHSDLNAANALLGVADENATPTPWLGLDPIGCYARTGEPRDVAAIAKSTGSWTPRLGRVITVDGVGYADAGATPAQQLGWMLATGVEYLRALESAGTAMADAAASIGLRVGARAEQFVTTAAMRALRAMWAGVLNACGVPSRCHNIRIHAVTPEAQFSRLDPWVNQLRSTAATLGAVIGGADAVTVLPHDVAVRAGDSLAWRAARNLQLLLVDESGIARLTDPAAGSWFVESLTASLAESAWKVFREVQAVGGMELAVESGMIATALQKAWDKRSAALATRREVVTGVSMYPVAFGDTGTDEFAGVPATPAGHSSPGGLTPRRPAGAFEALRDAGDRPAVRPTVFAAALGDLATHTARSTWVSNLLAVAGVALVGAQGDGAMSPLEAEARFIESGCSVAVICSSDDLYALRATATATALKEAGAHMVALAGSPHIDVAGVDEYWYDGMDVIVTLRRLHELLGVQ